MLKISGRSDWSFETSSSKGISAAIIVAVGAGGGTISLNHPNGAMFTFNYASAGVGYGMGAKAGIASLAPSKWGASSSGEDNFSLGYLYILDSFHGKELQPSDIVGGTLTLELTGAMLKTISGSAMLLGIDLGEMQNELMSDIGQLVINVGGGPLALDFAESQGWFQSSAKAVLFMGGLGASLGVGVSAMGNLGYLWLGAVKPGQMEDWSIPAQELISGPRETFSVKDRPNPISLPGDVLFRFDKFDLRIKAFPALHAAGQKIRSNSGRRVKVMGYTDNIGGVGYNKWLSEQRANHVKRWLVHHGYAKDSDVDAKGYGAEYPVARNNTAIGRSKNRRVEIVIL
jgi:outer membrane protein OmpA-like peptidoglycan-associated protein